MKFSTALPLLGLSLLLIGSGCTVTTSSGGSVTSSTTRQTEEEQPLLDQLWNGSTDAIAITQDPIGGTINGTEASDLYVQLEKRNDTWSWAFAAEAPSTACGFTSRASRVGLRMRDVQVGTFKANRDQVDFDDASAFYVFMQESGSPMTVNTDWDAEVVVLDLAPGTETTAAGDTIGTVTGFAEFTFADGKTTIAGAFEGEYCERQ